MGLKHCVVTSVTRDDLPDGGAEIWAETVRAVRRENPDTSIELLIPDFDAREDLIDTVIAAKPDIIGHNVETVARLTSQVRSRARYEVSLKTLSHIARSGCRTKSGLMVGLGETDDEVLAAIDDLVANGVRIMTIGQYLRPTLKHLPVADYVTPEKFATYKEEALRRGMLYVESGPMVRSSYMAEKAMQCCGSKNKRNMETVTSKYVGRTEYSAAWEEQKRFFNALLDAKRNGGGQAEQVLLFVEHPHVYTLGKSGHASNLLVDDGFLKRIGATYFQTDRGGDITYHGLGQLVGYPILDLERLGTNLKDYIWTIEESVIRTIAEYGIAGGRLAGATGVWIEGDSPRARKNLRDRSQSVPLRNDAWLRAERNDRPALFFRTSIRADSSTKESRRSKRRPGCGRRWKRSPANSPRISDNCSAARYGDGTREGPGPVARETGTD